MPCKKRSVGLVIFGFQKEVTLVSYSLKKSKSILILSTIHSDASIDETNNKPDVINFYNSTKGGFDTVDQLYGNYSVSWRTRRWPNCLFFHLLNIAGINSHIIYSERFPDSSLPRCHFFKSLEMSLMKPYLEEQRCKAYKFLSNAFYEVFTLWWIRLEGTLCYWD